MTHIKITKRKIEHWRKNDDETCNGNCLRFCVIPPGDGLYLCLPDENDSLQSPQLTVKIFSILRGGGYTWINMFYVTRISFQKAALVPVLLSLSVGFPLVSVVRAIGISRWHEHPGA